MDPSNLGIGNYYVQIKSCKDESTSCELGETIVFVVKPPYETLKEVGGPLSIGNWTLPKSAQSNFRLSSISWYYYINKSGIAIGVPLALKMEFSHQGETIDSGII